MNFNIIKIYKSSPLISFTNNILNCLFLVKSSYSKIVVPNISRIVTYDGKLLQTNGDLEIVKQLDTGHALCHLKRKRVRGYCVKCIKKLGSSIDYKKVLEKIFTYCPACNR